MTTRMHVTKGGDGYSMRIRNTSRFLSSYDLLFISANQNMLDIFKPLTTIIGYPCYGAGGTWVKSRCVRQGWEGAARVGGFREPVVSGTDGKEDHVRD
jgi:hypothetical protein